MSSALSAALAPYDATALSALASKGLVRRAARDVAQGLVSVGDYTDGIATLTADGESVRIGKAGPAAASCTCPSRSLCRHVLAATLFLAATAPPAGTTAHPTEPEAAEPIAASAVPRPRAAKPTPPVDIAFLDDVTDTLFAFLRSGFGPAPLSLEQRLDDLALSSRADALPRLSAHLRALAARAREKRRRTETADPEATLALLAETFALTTALRGPAHQTAERFANLRGRVREDFEPVGELHLTGIGASLWSTHAGARGVTAYFYEPERERWFTATLARAGQADPSFRPSDAFRREAVWTTATLEQLTRAEVRLTGAAATADGRLSLAKNVRAETSALNDIAGRVRTWPVTFASWEQLQHHLRAAVAPALTGPKPTRHVVLLRPKLAADPFSEPFTQRLIWPLADDQGRWLALSVPDGAERDGVANALASLADRSRIACVAALAVRNGQAFELQPFAALRSESESHSFESLGLDPSAPAGSGQSFFAQLTRRAKTRARGGPEQFVSLDPNASASTRALAEAIQALIAIAELGGLDAATTHKQRLNAAGKALSESGFDALGEAVARAANTPSADPEPLLVAAYLLTGTQALTAAIPQLRRV